MEIRTATTNEVQHFGLWSEDNAGEDLIVAVQNNQIVGFAQHTGTTIYFVESNAKGAGSALVAYIIDGADYAAADNVTGVSEGFWVRLGFQLESRNEYGQPVWTWYSEEE